VAIKGKKKAGSRGSQARRRPAAAPRPVSGTRRKEPWYNTATGRVIAALLVVLVLSGIGAVIAVNRSNANERSNKVEAIEEYVDVLESIVQSTAPSAAAMTQVTPNAPADQLESLRADARQWGESFEAAASRTSSATPPPEVASVNPFFTQSLQVYLSSARLMGDASSVDGDLAALLTRASEIRAQADSVWSSAVAQLDEELADLGGDPSGLQSPGLAAASGAVPPAPEPPPDEGGDGGGGGNGDGGGGG
jgi:hypothetical protein